MSNYSYFTAMRTIHVETELEAPADRVWAAMQHPVTFAYVCRGLIGVPSLAGRSHAFAEGESGTGRLLLFHAVPLPRHTIHLASVDDGTLTMRSREHSRMLRVWNHTLRVEPIAEDRARYSDTVEIDAGRLTALVARIAVGIYRYRQRRWRTLARRHLSSVRVDATH